MLEALRLFPPIPSILRMALKATNLGPYRVEQGENIMVQIMALHRSKKVWGEDAETFNPDRFLPAKKVSLLLRSILREAEHSCRSA